MRREQNGWIERENTDLIDNEQTKGNTELFKVLVETTRLPHDPHDSIPESLIYLRRGN